MSNSNGNISNSDSSLSSLSSINSTLPSNPFRSQDDRSSITAGPQHQPDSQSEQAQDSDVDMPDADTEVVVQVPQSPDRVTTTASTSTAGPSSPVRQQNRKKTGKAASKQAAPSSSLSSNSDAEFLRGLKADMDRSDDDEAADKDKGKGKGMTTATTKAKGKGKATATPKGKGKATATYKGKGKQRTEPEKTSPSTSSLSSPNYSDYADLSFTDSSADAEGETDNEQVREQMRAQDEANRPYAPPPTTTALPGCTAECLQRARRFARLSVPQVTFEACGRCRDHIAGFQYDDELSSYFLNVERYLFFVRSFWQVFPDGNMPEAEIRLSSPEPEVVDVVLSDEEDRWGSDVAAAGPSSAAAGAAVHEEGEGLEGRKRDVSIGAAGRAEGDVKKARKG